MKKNSATISGVTITYFSLFPLLKALEKFRPGIRKRVWNFICDHHDDDAFRAYNGRIYHLNLYYFGIGDEYPTKYLEEYPTDLKHCHKVFPKSFKKGSKDYELRLDLNLIWSIYDDQFKDPEMFYVLTEW